MLKRAINDAYLMAEVGIRLVINLLVTPLEADPSCQVNSLGGCL